MSNIDVIAQNAARDPQVKAPATALAASSTDTTTAEGSNKAFKRVLGGHQEERRDTDDMPSKNARTESSDPLESDTTSPPKPQTADSQASESAQPPGESTVEHETAGIAYSLSSDGAVITDETPTVAVQSLPVNPPAEPPPAQQPGEIDTAIVSDRETPRANPANPTETTPQLATPTTMAAPALALARQSDKNSAGSIAPPTASNTDKTMLNRVTGTSGITPDSNTSGSPLFPLTGNAANTALPAQPVTATTAEPVQQTQAKAEMPTQLGELKKAIEQAITQTQRAPQQAADTRLTSAALTNTSAIDAVTTSQTTVLDSTSLIRPQSAGDIPTLRTAVFNNAPQSVHNSVKMMLSQGLNTASVNLHPAELGAMRINIEMKSDQLQVQIIATQPTTRESLEAALPRLREQLESGGYSGVSIDLGGGTLDNSHSNQAQSNAPATESVIDTESVSENPTAPAAYQQQPGGNSLVDLFA